MKPITKLPLMPVFINWNKYLICNDLVEIQSKYSKNSAKYPKNILLRKKL